MEDNKKNRPITLFQNDQLLRTFKSQKEVAEFLNVSPQTIWSWLTGKTTPNGKLEGFRVEYATPLNMRRQQNLDELQLQKDSKGRIMPSPYNIRLWLSTQFDSIQINAMTDQIELDGEPLTDRLSADMSIKMEDTLGFNNQTKLEQTIINLGVSNTYNPLTSYLDRLEWDGKPRAEEFFIKFLGAKDTGLNRKYTKNWFKGAIRRAYEPGCMFDNMIIIHDSTGGTGKTKILERLSLGYYATNLDISNKDSINIMNSAWIVNFDELSRFDRKDMNLLKTFITTRADVNRLAYARFSSNFKRHCVFCGTTNDNYFLRDYTSDRERRFWVIECFGEKHESGWWKKNLPDSYIDQVWAEVISWYRENSDIEELTLSEIEEETIIQKNHKSFKKDLQAVLNVEDMLTKKYSKEAVSRNKLWRREANSFEDNSYINSVEMNEIPIKWIAGAINSTEDYAKAIVMSIPGWYVSDGKAIKIK